MVFSKTLCVLTQFEKNYAEIKIESCPKVETKILFKKMQPPPDHVEIHSSLSRRNWNRRRFPKYKLRPIDPQNKLLHILENLNNRETHGFFEELSTVSILGLFFFKSHEVPSVFSPVSLLGFKPTTHQISL